MSLLQPVEALQSVADQAFERLLSAIIQGEIAPGEFIKEARVARLLNISRGPLREAIGRLDGYKLLVRTRNMGAQVIAFTKKDIDELFSLRASLEGLSCALAATSMTDAELDNLQALVDRDAAATAADPSYRPADEDFHFQILRGSRNGRLINIVSRDIYYQLRVIRHRSGLSRDRSSAVAAEHQEILKALRSRNPQWAEAAMRHHISNARQAAANLADIGEPDSSN
ncbi:GntR family transcriptional regulator [soil metagenome]